MATIDMMYPSEVTDTAAGQSMCQADALGMAGTGLLDGG